MEQQNNRNDEELYALLDTALRDERLAVSEDLIGKALRRAGEAPAVPKGRKKPEYRRYLPYAGAVAAAALFVFLSKGIGAVRKSAESCAPESPKQEMNAGHDGMYLQGEYETSEAFGDAQTNSHGQGFLTGIRPADDSTGSNKGMQDGEVMEPALDGTGAAGLVLEEYKIPEGLRLVFEAAGYQVLDATAAVWKEEEAFADWEKELTMLFREGDCAVEASPGSIGTEESEGEALYRNGEELYYFDMKVEAMLAVKTERGTFFAVKTAGAETVVCFLK